VGESGTSPGPSAGALRLAWLAAAALALLAVFPFAAISTYGFFTLDDLVTYTRVKQDGWWSTLVWYYAVSMGRFSVIALHGGLTRLTQILGIDPWSCACRHWSSSRSRSAGRRAVSHAAPRRAEPRRSSSPLSPSTTCRAETSGERDGGC
jgi:hypothetical protein